MKIFLILGVGVLLGVVLAPWCRRTRVRMCLGDSPEELRARQMSEKAEGKLRILGMFAGAMEGRVRNNDVQNLLSVSDATATRYLDELEGEKLIKQVGDFGKYVYYEKR